MIVFRYNVDEIEEKPKTVFSALCNRWLSITGVRRACLDMMI